MPRKLKPYKVDDVAAGRERLPIFFDRDDKVFFAEIGMERVQHTDLVEAKKLAVQLLTRAPRYTWEPIIVVDRITKYTGTYHLHGEEAEHAEMDVTFYRCERAESPLERGRWFSRRHTIDFERDLKADRRPSWYTKEQRAADTKQKREEREANKNLGRFDGSSRKDYVILPYTEETWEGLTAIKLAIEETRARLAALISGGDLAERLKALAHKPLPPMLPDKSR